MASTTVSDYVIWAKHIHDDPELVARVLNMWAGETLQLEVDGVRGTWRKMDDGADGPDAGRWATVAAVVHLAPGSAYAIHLELDRLARPHY